MQEQLRNIDPRNWVSEHGETLYAYALSRLKNAEAAEDVVQEAFLGGLKSVARVPPQGEVGPWLMGILKKKVIDRQRQETRSRAATLDEEESVLDKLFDEHGHWSSSAKAANPLRLDRLERSEFMGILRKCLSGLPAKQAAVFVGREMHEQKPEDLCKELGISATNLWVLMHRARLRLADCIRARWAMVDR